MEEEETIKIDTDKTNKTEAKIYFECFHFDLALTNKRLDDAIPVSQMTNADAIGKAAC